MVNTFHPLFVHFPIALLIVSGIIALIDLLKANEQLKKIILWNLIFALISFIFTISLGFIDANAIPHNEIIHKIMEVHEKIGILLFAITFILTMWLIIRISKMAKLENLLFVILLWFAMALVSYNGYLGGKMVYDNGAGIKPMQNSFILDEAEEHEHEH